MLTASFSLVMMGVASSSTGTSTISGAFSLRAVSGESTSVELVLKSEAGVLSPSVPLFRLQPAITRD